MSFSLMLFNFPLYFELLSLAQSNSEEWSRDRDCQMMHHGIGAIGVHVLVSLGLNYQI